MEFVQMRRQTFSKFLLFGGKKSSGNVVMTYPERPQREGQHLQGLVLVRTKNETLFSIEWKSEHLRCGMRGAVAVWFLKDSEMHVENLCLQCKMWWFRHDKTVYQGFIVLWSGWRAHKSWNTHGTLGINPNKSKREDLDEECLQKVGWEWVSWEERCRLA